LLWRFLGGPHPDDTEEVTAVRQQEEAIIKQWIDDASQKPSPPTPSPVVKHHTVQIIIFFSVLAVLVISVTV
jgi:hypothetical protein